MYQYAQPDLKNMFKTIKKIGRYLPTSAAFKKYNMTHQIPLHIYITQIIDLFKLKSIETDLFSLVIRQCKFVKLLLC